MSQKDYREEAEPLAKEIMHKIENHLRYKMGVWPKIDDLKDMHRIVKSILVVDSRRKDIEKRGEDD